MEIKQEIEKRSFAVKITSEEDGRTVGRVRLYILYNELHAEPYGYMEDLFVEEAYRSKGVGRKLVDAVLAEAKKLHCYKLVLTSRYDRKTVHEWYKKIGFADYGFGFKMEFLIK
jgi:GNAT superfamily N-acetyltransferase